MEKVSLGEVPVGYTDWFNEEQQAAAQWPSNEANKSQFYAPTGRPNHGRFGKYGNHKYGIPRSF